MEKTSILPEKLSNGSSGMLDLIRGLSAQLVLIGHGLGIFHVFNKEQIERIPQMQCIAVVIFFILSGFVITHTLISREQTFKSFFINRFSRIYSAFIPCLVLVFIIDTVSNTIAAENFEFTNSLGLKTFFGNLFMLQDFPVKQIGGAVPTFGSGEPFWSLAVEWWIYMFVGYLILQCIKNNSLSWINITLLGILAIVPVANIIGKNSSGLTIYWLLGAVAYLLYRINILQNISPKFKLFLFATFIGLAGLKVFITKDEYNPFFAVFLTGSILLLVEMFRTKTLNSAIQKFGNYIASYSYTLYLLHYTILILLNSLLGNILDKWTLLIIGILVSNVTCAFCGRFFEIRFTQLIKNSLRRIGLPSYVSSKPVNV